MNHVERKLRPILPVLGALALALLALPWTARADSTDIAQVPLFTSSTGEVKPNLLFILDDSGSMNSDFLPDEAGFSGAYGRTSYQCNGVAYNPSINYLPPKNYDGTTKSDASTANLDPDPNLQTTSQRNLASPISIVATGLITLTVTDTGRSSSWYSSGKAVTVFSGGLKTQWMTGTVYSWDKTTGLLKVTVDGAVGSGTLTSPKVGNGTPVNSPVYYKYTGSQPALSYTYNSSGSLITSSTFYKECSSAIGSSPGSGVFTAVTVTTASADAQNYANWNAYYRTRMLMMKTSISQAFAGIDDKYRVGFTVISDPTMSTATGKTIDVADFTATQKQSFYTTFNAQTPNSWTPLRGALSKAGQYFANKASGQGSDPMQYACQKNFTILSTDGYWNTPDEHNTGGRSQSTDPNYGPFQLDNTTRVGEQDAGAARPMRDGTVKTTTAVTPYTQQQHQTIRTTTTVTQTWQRFNYTLTACSKKAGGGNTLTKQEQRNTAVMETDNADQAQVRTGSYNVTVTSVNDVAGTPVVGSTSWGSWSNDGSVVTSKNPVTPAPTAPTGTWANYGSATTVATCSATAVLPSPNPSGITSLGNSSATGSPTTIAGATDAAVAGTTSSSDSFSGGSSDSLADVAYYYYNTDLRTKALGNCTGGKGSDVCNGTVTPVGNDTATWRHMTTFTLGLGASGTLTYTADYDSSSDTSTDYFKLKNGTKNWPNPGDDAGAVNIDDLWHAAVNGHGKYFSAKDPSTLARSLQDAINAVKQQTGSGSAAATSTLRPVSGDNGIYLAQYTSALWTGDLVAYKIDVTTGDVVTTVTDPNTHVVSDAADWHAGAQLDKMVAAGTARKIYFNSAGSLAAFDYSHLTAAGLNGYFDNACSKSPALTQCGSLSSSDKTIANTGSNLVSFLSGQAFSVYRTRTKPENSLGGALLGDIEGGAPVFVGAPQFKYVDGGYAKFKTDNAARQRVVIAAANDGMVHAFKAETGDEMWAYVPTMVMSNLYILADADYANRHRYFVDGAPVVGDVYDGSAWRTILVGGLNAGGKGYYALDITDTKNPKLLWEFTNKNLGLSFGNPIITKRSNGQWVVAFGSGYNNNSDGGDGIGRLFVLDAVKGTQVISGGLATTAGDGSHPSGLARVNAWVQDDTDNTAMRFYGGDLQGNLWRFDVDGRLSTDHSANAVQMAQLVAGGKTQPITVIPQVALVQQSGFSYPVVYVGTGQYLGTKDLSTTDVQSIYGIKDPLDMTGLGDVRAGGTLVKQTISNAGSTSRTVGGTPVDWTTKNGWYVDLIDSGERVNVDPQIVFNVLTVSSNIPHSDACSAGGSSWIYRFDITTGLSTQTDGTVGSFLGNKQIVGLTIYQLSDGTIVTTTTFADGTLGRTNKDTDIYTPSPARRTSWRELVDD